MIHKGHNILVNAKKEKADDFYTQLSDIEKELKYYKSHFKNKVVLCNCDDPSISNFFHYFSYNFENLKLKKLITTCYKNQERDLFSKNKNMQAIFLEYEGDKNKNKIPDLKEIGVNYLLGDGDFRSTECVSLLEKADIIVTNPPWSLFREYVDQLIKFKKKFLIMGPQNAFGYKTIFKLIKENKLWIGHSIKSGDREFEIPDDYVVRSKKNLRVDSNGKRYLKVPGVRWFTNLEYEERHKDLILYKTYKNNESEYPKYKNYDAINVDDRNLIPMDYKGNIGVPISFLNKFNPDQFEIIALGVVGSIDFSSNRKMEILKNGKPTNKFTFNGKGTLYRKHNPKIDKKPPAFKDCITGDLYQSIYSRIIVKNKKL